MADFEAPEPNSNLGERLLAGVRNLWARVQAIEVASDRTNKVANQQGIEIEIIKKELGVLKAQMHGLKVSRGRARAKSARLEEQSQLAEAERLMPEIEKRLN